MAEEFSSRRGRFETFVKNHNPTVGSANEAILREFLARHMPGKLAVDQGFICDIKHQNRISRQCDIIIHDHSEYAPLYSVGPVMIVEPKSARLVIEVKTQYAKGAIANIAAVKAMRRSIHGIVFAFQSSSPDAVINSLKTSRCATGTGPDAIFLFDQGVIIHNVSFKWNGNAIVDFEHSDNYTAHLAPTDKTGVVVAILLYFAIYATSQNNKYELMTALGKSINDHTEVFDRFCLGQTINQDTTPIADC